MTRTLAARGPEGDGFHFDGPIGLGFRRLGFVDLAHGAQPLFNEDRSIALVCNGEIYNHVELRNELRAQGHSFATGSDCETIIHLYEKHGSDAFSRLEGMFAFALWNAKTRELILARDPFGIKPLHYAETRNGVLFASELKALLVCEEIERAVDAAALDDYLTGLSVRDPSCILRGVKKVPPASYVRIPASGRPDVRRYWTLPPVDDRPERTEAALVEEVRAELQNSVRLSYRSDVPVGLFLSGGVDSTALALAARTAGLADVPSFCVGFDEPAFDESRFAADVAKGFGFRHRDTKLTKEEAAGLAERIGAHLDEPFGDASVIPTLRLSMLAREQVKGVASGEGADELFGGNFWHRPGFAPRPGAPPYGAGIAFSSDEAVAVCAPDIARDIRRARADRPEENAAVGSDAARLDLKTYLPSDLLVKMDRIPMMVGLEVRVPYLSRRMAEFALRIPWRFKVRDSGQKIILKKAIEGRVPTDVTTRPKKGFGVPLDTWIWEEGRFRDLVRDVVLSEKARSRGYFNPAAVDRMFGEHDRLQRLHGHRIWLAFMFEMWCRTWVDRRTAIGKEGQG